MNYRSKEELLWRAGLAFIVCLNLIMLTAAIWLAPLGLPIGGRQSGAQSAINQLSSVGGGVAGCAAAFFAARAVMYLYAANAKDFYVKRD